jgi:hypothetical protein
MRIITAEDKDKILKLVIELKYTLVNIGEFQDASLMRDMEKKYLDIKLEENGNGN